MFTYFCIPETKGLALEDVDVLYQNTTPMRSVQWRREHMEGDLLAAHARTHDKLDHDHQHHEKV